MTIDNILRANLRAISVENVWSEGEIDKNLKDIEPYVGFTYVAYSQLGQINFLTPLDER